MQNEDEEQMTGKQRGKCSLNIAVLWNSFQWNWLKI